MIGSNKKQVKSRHRNFFHRPGHANRRPKRALTGVTPAIFLLTKPLHTCIGS